MGVRLSTPRAVLLRQERVDLNDRPFDMLKRRSMVVDADECLKHLATRERSAGNTAMFEMKNNRAVTPSAVLCAGSASMNYPDSSTCTGAPCRWSGRVRRSSTKWRSTRTTSAGSSWSSQGSPGFGKSAVGQTWEDTVRFGLYCVEKWSMTGDILIRWRTTNAVFTRSGAY